MKQLLLILAITLASCAPTATPPPERTPRPAPTYETVFGVEMPRDIETTLEAYADTYDVTMVRVDTNRVLIYVLIEEETRGILDFMFTSAKVIAAAQDKHNISIYFMMMGPDGNLRNELHVTCGWVEHLDEWICDVLAYPSRVNPENLKWRNEGELR